MYSTFISENLKEDQELWDIFSRKEEYNAPFLDRHKRFCHMFSSNRNCMEARASKSLVDRGFRMDYKGGRRFAVCLTHDIDCLNISRDCILDVLKNIGSITGARRDLLIKMPFYTINQKSNPIFNFKTVMEMEERYDARSTFFFMTAKRDLGRMANYNIEDYKETLREIQTKGWEVGLHCGYHSFDNLREIKSEKQRLEKVSGCSILGCRNHYLRFCVPDTWDIIKKAGFEYDTTFGYADFAGFRNGMCHPFRPFDLNRQRTIDILEIPLMIMDGTLFEYMNLDESTAWKLTKKLIDTVEMLGGAVSILWHNTSMIGWKKNYYQKILAYCSEKDAWMTTCAELCKLYNKMEER